MGRVHLQLEEKQTSKYSESTCAGFALTSQLNQCSAPVEESSARNVARWKFASIYQVTERKHLCQRSTASTDPSSPRDRFAVVCSPNLTTMTSTSGEHAWCSSVFTAAIKAVYRMNSSRTILPTTVRCAPRSAPTNAVTSSSPIQKKSSRNRRSSVSLASSRPSDLRCTRQFLTSHSGTHSKRWGSDKVHCKTRNDTRFHRSSSTSLLRNMTKCRVNTRPTRTQTGETTMTIYWRQMTQEYYSKQWNSLTETKTWRSARKSKSIRSWTTAKQLSKLSLKTPPSSYFRQVEYKAKPSSSAGSLTSMGTLEIYTSNSQASLSLKVGYGLGAQRFHASSRSKPSALMITSMLSGSHTWRLNMVVLAWLRTWKSCRARKVFHKLRTGSGLVTHQSLRRRNVKSSTLLKEWLMQWEVAPGPRDYAFFSS